MLRAPVACDLGFSCAQASGQTANPSYSVGAIDFDLASGDYPNSGAPRRISVRGMSDTVTTGDTDRFIFQHTMPITIRHQGRAVWAYVTIRQTDGTIVTSNGEICGTTIAPRACLAFTGSGTVDVEIEVTHNDDSAAQNLTAYGFSW